MLERGVWQGSDLSGLCEGAMEAVWRMELVLGTLFTLVQELSQPLELALQAVGMGEGRFPAHSLVF